MMEQVNYQTSWWIDKCIRFSNANPGLVSWPTEWIGLYFREYWGDASQTCAKQFVVFFYQGKHLPRLATFGTDDTPSSSGGRIWSLSTTSDGPRPWWSMGAETSRSRPLRNKHCPYTGIWRSGPLTRMGRLHSRSCEWYSLASTRERANLAHASLARVGSNVLVVHKVGGCLGCNARGASDV